MPKKKEEENIDKKAIALSNLKKKYGNDVIMQVGKDIDFKVDWVSTGCFSLDEIIGSGLPRGRIIEVFGAESCLAGNMFIPYELRTKNGKRQNCKGGNIERLYNRFHGLKIKGKGNYQKKQTVNSDFFVSSINENNAVIKNKILDVVDCGKKECFRVTTEKGHRLDCTEEHKFYIGNGQYLPLSDLPNGSEIYVHENTTLKGRAPKIRYKEILVKYHPTAPQKKVNGYKYYRIKVANAVYEANMNGLSFGDYRKLLNNGKPKSKINTIPKGYHIHHKNFDPHDDRLENLELMKGKEHNRLHALRNGDKLNFVVTPDIIKERKNIGKIPTYDIKCQSPYNNYIANNIVVHNSGKSTMSLFLMAQIQKNGGNVALIDAENAFDGSYAANIGLDISKIMLAQPGSLEESMDIIKELIEAEAVDMIVVDSVSALVPKSEAEGDDFMKDTMAIQARLMSRALRILAGPISKSKTILIFINQIRDKVGVFWGAKTTTSGGRALKFFSSVRLEVSKGKKIEKGDVQIGNEIIITAVKNKVGFPWKKTTLDLYYAQGIDIIADAFDIGVRKEIIKKEGITFSFGDVQLGVGREKAINALKKDEDTYKKLSEEITKSLKEKNE